MNWKKATEIISQIAAAARHSARQGLRLEEISPELVWLGSKAVQTPPIYQSGPQGADRLVGSIGQLWLRLILGSDGNVDELKQGVPNAVQTIIHETMETGADERQMLKKLIKLGEKIREEPVPEKLTPRKTQTAYFSWLKRTPETILATEWSDIDRSDLPFAEQPETIDDIDSAEFVSGDDAGRPVTRYKRSILVPVVSSITMVAALAAAVVALTANRPNSTVARSSTNNGKEIVKSEFLENGESDSIEDPEGLVPQTGPTKPNHSIPDDGVTLWESATAGSPVEFTHVPYSPALAFHLRWADLVGNESGQKTLKALGPATSQAIQSWRALFGVADEDIESVLVTLHTSDEFRYQPFTIAKLSKPYELEQLVSAWSAEVVAGESAEGTFYRAADDNCYVILGTDGNSVHQFAFGSEQLIAECIELRDVSALSGGMKRIAEWSDQDRFADIMFLTQGLFNDEGQKLMEGPLLPLNRQLSYLLDRSIRGGILGVHFDHDAYLEVRLDSTVDLKPEAAQEHFKDLIAMAIGFATRESESGSAAEYWKGVSQRYAAMLQHLQQSIRFGARDRNLVANSWLPGAAVHNIVAGTELFLTVGYSPTAEQEVVTASVPASIEELLQMPRDLSIATNPDLIVLLNNLQQEIRDDFAALPFDFEIRLIGADLSKEGITQNQRPSDIDMQQQPLSKILTEIMVKANPDKNITGPDDPNCKMVWVLEADPDEPDRKIIMITTRGAAEEKGYTLPEDFSVDETAD